MKDMSIKPGEEFVLKVGAVHSYAERSWVGCFQDIDGAIYLPGKKKILDAGKTVVSYSDKDDKLDEISILNKPEGCVLSRPGLFLALHGYTHYRSPGIYHVKSWRSTDCLKTIKEEKAIINVSEGAKGERAKGEWYGLFVSRSILEISGGILLATMTGQFENDRISTTDPISKRETPYKNRSFVVYSEDKGSNWHYLSTIVSPQPEDPVGEGFDEPTMVRLDSGQLLCVMRTGHCTPLYASWSSDEGKTWTKPVYTGLERGCWPCLLKLSDGRIVLSYGKRYPEGWSRIRDDYARWKYPGVGLVKLAISSDGTGENWQETTIGSRLGSTYTTIIEVEPNILFCQIDGWFFRVMLMPRIPNTL